MIICKRPVPPDDHLEVAGSGVTRGDGTEGGEGGEREEEKKFLRTERDGPTEGSTRGPRESKIGFSSEVLKGAFKQEL